ncbi:hypothetical protein HMPREF1326_03100 [Akkermansia sp. KLE1605]|nr:hypothetical protein HMPREF1326_03100 [Akkermansia sp. KLE1605]
MLLLNCYLCGEYIPRLHGSGDGFRKRPEAKKKPPFPEERRLGEN